MGDQPAAAAGKIPLSSLQSYLQHPRDEAVDIDQWLTQFSPYLDIVGCNRAGQPLNDWEKNMILCSNIGSEGLRTFSGTDQNNNKDQLPYADFRTSVRNHFAKKQS
ncbi:MAG: hypothetical protein GY696_03050, partial [Gammaproteobacteria bacterium]|nr:hypothetical protein [Gammaproteobacteria bacterium]